MATIADNVQAVGARIARAASAARRDPSEVTLLAVTKSHPLAIVDEARRAGLTRFGENYVQDALPKIDAFPDLEWHLIGPLQSNKTRAAAERFDWVQSVDREKIARRLSEQRPAGLAALNVLVQVNVSGEATKSGVLPGELAALAEAIRSLPRLRLRGLMAIPEPGARAVSQFRKMKELFDGLRSALELDTLSMGMSDDLEEAVAAGATMVRVGTALFGARRSAGHAA